MRSFLDSDGRLVVQRDAVAKSWEQSFNQVPLLDGGATAAKLSKPYANSVWVMRAIKHVVDPITSVPMVITRDARGGDVVVDDAALNSFWQRPAKTRGGLMRQSALIKATGGQIKLRGNAFWVLDESWLMRSAKKSPLLVPHPASMRAILGQDRELIGWSMRDANGRNHVLIPDQVIHFKLWNPYDDIMGLSEWEAAMVAADSDYAAGVFARNLMRNNGDRGPIIVSKEGMMGDEQIQQIVKQLRNKQELARAGKFVGAFLPGDVEVKDPAVQAVDAAYVTQRLENRHEIFIAFGVPPSMASLTASYSVGSASDRFRLIEDTCQPLAEMIAEGMEEVSRRFLGTMDEIFVEFDFDEHSTMQQARAERIEAMEKLVDRGMPMRDAGEYLRMKLPRFVGDEIARVPFNLVVVENADSGDEKPEEQDADDVVADLEKLFARRKASKSACCEGHAKAAQSDERRKLWERVHRERGPWEKRFEKTFQKHLFAARVETLKNIETAKQLEEKSVVLKASPSDLVFNFGGWINGLLKDMLGLSRNAIEEAGQSLWKNELLKDDPLTMPAAETLAALRDRENKIKDAGDRVFVRIQEELQDGITKGETMDELAERTRRAFGALDKQRSRSIAVTETTVAFESGRDMTFKQAGIEWTEWVSSGDGRERDSHRAADGQIREMDDPFEVGGYELAFPGDPNGPPQEVIQCRCVRIARSGPDTGDVIGNDDSEIPF